MNLPARRPLGPLAARRILLLRAPETAEKLCEELRKLGAVVRAIAPLVECPASSTAQNELRAALQQVKRFQALIFTSARAVHATQKQWQALGLSLPWPEDGPDFASVGPATSRAIEEAFGIRPKVEAPQGHGQSLATALLDAFPQSARFLWPRNEAADGAWMARMEKSGHQLLAPVAYAMGPAPPQALAEALAWAEGVVAYSPEGWRAALAAWQSAGPKGKQGPWGVAIGPSTALAMAHGLGGMRACAQKPEDAALRQALLEAFKAQKQ